MSLREYFTCKNCGFSYTEVNYYFCFRDDTGLIERYESLFSTVGYSSGSPVRGRIIQHYCKNCDKTVYIYQTGLGASIFSRESTIDFLRELLPKKQDRLLKTAVLLKKLVDLTESDASLMELNDFVKGHEDDIHWKIDFNDYLSEKSFESTDSHIKERDAGDFDKEIANGLGSNDHDLKSIFRDMSGHLNEISASDLNLNEFYFDISQRFNDLSEDLRELEREIICINYYGDDFNITLDGDEIDEGICPECGEGFYIISPDNPCPKCGKEDIKYKHIFFD